MRKAFVLLVFSLSLATPPVSPAVADEASRRACCLEMGGRYVRNNHRMVCTGLGLGRGDAFYQCVIRKMSGGRKR
jgi:hypothetical protein